MQTTHLPPSIHTLLTSDQPTDQKLNQLMGAIVQYLNCDRCFLYLRDPQTRLGRVPFCWTRSPDVPIVYDKHWKPEPADLADGDPMFAAALHTNPSIFVEDVETASPMVLNAQFEHENFGHRALIHGHLCHEGQLWGVLQPCLMNQPRTWTEAERSAIAEIIQIITPLAIEFVPTHKPISENQSEERRNAELK